MQLRQMLYTLTTVMAMVLSMAINAAYAGGVPLPELPKAAQGDECVEPIDIMRRLHGAFLKHQRDDTMHQGIRTKQHSLIGCIDCHVTPNEKGEYPDIHSKQHFCNSCHEYAAVSVDCFQCHATKPTAQVAVSTKAVAPAATESTSETATETVEQTQVAPPEETASSASAPVETVQPVVVNEAEPEPVLPAPTSEGNVQVNN